MQWAGAGAGDAAGSGSVSSPHMQHPADLYMVSPLYRALHTVRARAARGGPVPVEIIELSAEQELRCRGWLESVALSYGSGVYVVLSAAGRVAIAALERGEPMPGDEHALARCEAFMAECPSNLCDYASVFDVARGAAA